MASRSPQEEGGQKDHSNDDGEQDLQGAASAACKIDQHGGMPLIRGGFTDRKPAAAAGWSQACSDSRQVPSTRQRAPLEEPDEKLMAPTPGTRRKPEASAVVNFWKDPNGESCCICGEEENHTELTCPYNYLSPAAYVPCRARLVVSRTPKATPSGARRFLQRFVRVNNLPEHCRPVCLVRLFSRFGPLRMWHVAMENPQVCKGLCLRGL